jgi:hypothetical protein
LLGAALAAALAAGIVPASAQQAHPGVVSQRPVAWTPHIQDGTVRAITVVGDTVVVGGTFTAVSDAARAARYDRAYLVAFGLRDGRVRAFHPRLDGPVYALAPGPAGTVYVGGAFRTVNGVTQRSLTQLRLDTGARVPAFRGALRWGDVRSMAVHGPWLYVGGYFVKVSGAARTALARLHARTGAVDPGFDARLSRGDGRRVKVDGLAVSPDGRRLVAVGAMTHAGGRSRHRLVMVDTSVTPARISGWYTDAYEPACQSAFDTYLRGVDFAPDGRYFVVVTTGHTTHPRLLCNTAARFEATGTGRHGPTWVNHTGGNSLYAVAVTGAAVYVGGHQRWMNNPYGSKAAGPGAVPREGIAALHPTTGRALSWDPGRSRGVGLRAFAATPGGLLVGSDTDRLAREYHGRIGMFPLA